MAINIRYDDWIRPGAYEVFAEVYRIPLPLPNDGLKAVNAYVIRDELGSTLIDPGWDIEGVRELLLESLHSIDLTMSNIHQILVTHSHRDHFSQALSLRHDFEIPVRLGANERPSVEKMMDPKHVPLDSQIEQLLFCGAQELVLEIAQALDQDGPKGGFTWQVPDQWLSEGTVDLASGGTIDVIETPGHTRGHLVFRDPSKKLLFSGDHILPRITPSIGFEPATSENPLANYLLSLARLRAEPEAMLLPAHGPVVLGAHERIDQLIEHHSKRIDEILNSLKSGAKSGLEVAEDLKWTRNGIRLNELDWFNRMLAVCETYAHLSLLVSQERVSMEQSNGINEYS